MRSLRCLAMMLLAGSAIVACAVVVVARSALAAEGVGEASEMTAQQTPTAPRNVLVAGADAVADGNSPAVITIDLDKEVPSPQTQLELAIEPIRVAPKERYVITVSANAGGARGANQQLGSFSFYVPPRVGERRTFLVDVPTLPAAWKAEGKSRIDLSVALNSVDQDQRLAVSAIRIVGARIVGGS